MLASCCPSKKGGELDNVNNEVHPNSVKYPSVQTSRGMGDWILIGFMLIVAVLFFAFCIGSIVAPQSDGNVSKITHKYVPAIKTNILDKPVTGVPSNGKTTGDKQKVSISFDNASKSAGGSQKPAPIEDELPSEIGPVHAEWRGMNLWLELDNPKYVDGKDVGVYEFWPNGKIDEPQPISNWKLRDEKGVNKGDVNFSASIAKEWKTLTVNLFRRHPWVRVATKTIVIPNFRKSLQDSIGNQFKLHFHDFPAKDVWPKGHEKYFKIFPKKIIALTRHYCKNCEFVHLDDSSFEVDEDSDEDSDLYFYFACIKYNTKTSMWAWRQCSKSDPDLKLVPQ
eukprot:134704_1